MGLFPSFLFGEECRFSLKAKDFFEEVWMFVNLVVFLQFNTIVMKSLYYANNLYHREWI